MIRFSLLSLTFAILIGCDDSRSSRLVQSLPQMHAANITSELKDRDSIMFQSWAGLHQGFDSDTHVTLYKGGKADITYSGYGVQQVVGTWGLNGDEIVLDAPISTLGEMPGAADWPPMQLFQGGGRLFLSPTRKTDALRYGDDDAWPLGELYSTVNDATNHAMQRSRACMVSRIENQLSRPADRGRYCDELVD
ncbi:hypothetical protein [Rhodopirellula sp. P2]|uniref:hypothetical protein n=1 Tax=Rhodopirellula sp. P2 TaxID=2127060 RepID=UPI002368249E|nr:hypothetical protein [Rhodopirellula sp. P2]WDQ15442.1 hypothetical protein PSR62_17570 [Rhodopirellula sp. P2]